MFKLQKFLKDRKQKNAIWTNEAGQWKTFSSKRIQKRSRKAKEKHKRQKRSRKAKDRLRIKNFKRIT